MEIQYNIERQLHNPIVMQSQKETWFVGSQRNLSFQVPSLFVV